MFHITWNTNLRWLISLALLLMLFVPAWAGGDTGCGCCSNCACVSTLNDPYPCNGSTYDCGTSPTLGCGGSDCGTSSYCGTVCYSYPEYVCGGAGTCLAAFCGAYSCTCGNNNTLTFCYNTESTCDDWRCGHGSSPSMLEGGSILGPAPMATWIPGVSECVCEGGGDLRVLLVLLD